MKIELMTAEDYDEVYNLWEKSAGVSLRDPDDSREGIERYLRRNPRTCFIASEHNRIIGSVLSGHDGRRGYIYHLAVDKQHRKKGLGKKLVEKAIQSLVKEGINKAACVSFKKNKDGNIFWEKMGFLQRKDLLYRDKLFLCK